MVSLKHKPQNDYRFDDLMKEVRELGRTSGKGSNARGALFERVVRASYEGIIDLTPNKHGEGIDDARKMYDAYVENEGKTSSHGEATKAAKASDMRTGIKFGIHECGGSVDPIAVMERVQVTHQRVRETDPKSVKSLYQALVDTAREQLKIETELNEQEVDNLVRKPEKAEKQVVEIVEKIRKDLEKLISGERADGVMCQEQAITDAHESLRGWLNGIAAANEEVREQEQIAAYMMRHNLTMVPAAPAGEQVAA